MTSYAYGDAAERHMDRLAHEDERALHAALAAGDEEGILAATGACALGVCALTQVCARPSLRTPSFVGRLRTLLPACGVSRENPEDPLVSLFRASPDEVCAAVWDHLIVSETDFWSVVVENPSEDARDRFETPLWELALVAGPPDILTRMEKSGWSPRQIACRPSPNNHPSHPLAAMASRVTSDERWMGPGVSNRWTSLRRSVFLDVSDGLIAQGFSWNDIHPVAPMRVIDKLAERAPWLAAEVLRREQACRLAGELTREMEPARSFLRPRL